MELGGIGIGIDIMELTPCLVGTSNESKMHSGPRDICLCVFD